MIYLDSAATTLEKPQTVPAAVYRAIKRLSSTGRGGYRSGVQAAELMYRCREFAAKLFHVPSPEQVVLTMNATHGLNLAIHSLVRPGSTVLISGYEHNAVTRPLYGMRGVSVKIAAGELFKQDSVYDAFQRKLTDDVDVVVCNHVSNVFGFVQPVEKIAELCRRCGKPLIVDAAQSAGTLPIDLMGWGAAFVAMPGHKGLYGPQGTGMLLCGSETSPLLFGGTGSDSIRQNMPEFLPDRLEAGTQNVCGAAGLLAGMQFVNRIGISGIMQHECNLCQRMMDILERVPNIQIFRGSAHQSGLFSFAVENVDCEILGEELGHRGVAVRTGLHCAPLAHQTAGTIENGTVRISFSVFNTMQQVERAAKIICDAIACTRVR